MGIEGKINNRYRIIKEIGQGGMAKVYLAEDEVLERQVAVKVIRMDEIPPSQLERVMERFRREAKNLARLTDVPGVVTLLDYGVQDETPFLVMTHMAGGTLKDRMGTLILPAEAARMLLTVAETLAIVHEKGIIHRDIKPSNILIDSYGKFALADFGIAKAFDMGDYTLTGTGLGVGTVAYMAPEQWRGKPVSQSDLYSLGVIFYEMITGRKPFEAETASDVFLKVMTEELTDPREYVTSLDERVVAFLKKAVARDAKDRHMDASEFFEELLEIREPKPVSTPEVAHKPKPKELPPVDDETRDEYLEQLDSDETNLEEVVVATSTEDFDSDEKGIQSNPIVSDSDAKKSSLEEALNFSASDKEPVPVLKPSELPFMNNPSTKQSQENVSGANLESKKKKRVWSFALIGLFLIPLIIAGVIGNIQQKQWDYERTQEKAFVYYERTQTQYSITEYAQQTKTVKVDRTKTAEAENTYRTQTQSSYDTAYHAARTQTAQAQIIATEQAIDAAVKDVEDIEAKSILIFESESGKLFHKEDDFVETTYLYVDEYIVEESNFILEVDFSNPYGANYHTWDFGVMFRHYAGNDQYRLVVQSDKSWTLMNRTGDESDTIQWGNLPNLNVLDSESNRLKLVVYNEIGYFYLNDEFISELDLSTRLDSGNILIGTGFYNGSELDNEATFYQNLNFWSFSAESTATPMASCSDDFSNVSVATTGRDGYLYSWVFYDPDGWADQEYSLWIEANRYECQPDEDKYECSVDNVNHTRLECDSFRTWYYGSPKLCEFTLQLQSDNCGTILTKWLTEDFRE